MVELNSDEELYLKEILAWEDAGEDVGERICERIDSLIEEKSHDALGIWTYKYKPDYQKTLDVYDSLAAKKMLNRFVSKSVTRDIHPTSDGRAYFRDKAAGKKSKEAERRREHWFQIALIVLSILLGLIAGYVGQKIAESVDGETVYRVEVVNP